MQWAPAKLMLRHDLVYLQPEADWQSPCAAPGSPLAQAAQRWLAAGRPLVAARQPADEEMLLLGLTLPTAQERQRLTIRVAATAVERCRPPLQIEQCLHRLPAAHALELGALAERARAGAIALGVYGSLAWEAISGESYRHPASDIDLICDVASEEQLIAALGELERAAARLPCRLDGEIRFPDGNAVAWREILAHLPTPETPVLAKGQRDVALLPLARLIATLSPEHCHA